jgi:hypothetical protein
MVQPPVHSGILGQSVNCKVATFTAQHLEVYIDDHNSLPLACIEGFIDLCYH